MKEKTVHRIDKIRKHYNLTVSDLEKRIGYSNNAFHKALKSNASIKDELILTLLEEFKEVNLRWLITGKGEMLGDDGSISHKRVAHYVRENHDAMLKEDDLYAMWFDGKKQDVIIEYLEKRQQQG